MDDENLTLVFIVLLLVVVMAAMYTSIKLSNSVGIPGPQGPPGPVTEIPIIRLPITLEDGDDFLVNYKESAILITGQTHESFGLPSTNPAIVKIWVVYSTTGVPLKTYIYNVYDYQGDGKEYYRLRVVSADDETVGVNETGWQVISMLSHSPLSVA
jgi:hypothetical protein